MFCQRCGAQAQTRYVEFYQNIGALFVRFSKSIKGDLCRNCIGACFWDFTLKTLLLGWWGIISLLVTPFYVINNVARYVMALRLPRPEKPPVLTDAAVEKMKPYIEELIRRLHADEPLESVAGDIAPRAGVTPAEVRLLVVALVRDAKERQTQAEPQANTPPPPASP